MENISKNLRILLVASRPLQWVKNLAVFAAIFFGGKFFYRASFDATVFTFAAFCFAASSSYLLNDLVDRKADRLHSLKRVRPLASGQLGFSLAIGAYFLFSFVSLFLSWLVSLSVLALVLLYLIVQISYNFYFKKVILLELLVIAFGFVLRVFAGSFASGVALSSWLILTVLMLSLFLAIGKRRSETTLLEHSQAVAHRSTLASYPINLLDGLVFLSATSALTTYSLFTFNEPLRGSKLLSGFLPPTLATPKLLMLTIPVVVYGIFRYLYLVFEKKQGESPEKILLTDKPILASVLLWLGIVAVIVYLLPTTR